jgi:RND family efflux transporter MFP subunit
MDGVVAHISRSEGDTINSNDWLGSIYNTSDMRMSVMVDDIDVMLINQDSPVEVTLDAVSGKTYKGEVEFISTMGEERDGITRFRVEINVEGGAELRPGMQAKAFIDAGSAEDVLLVPVEALFEEDNKPKVEVLNDDGSVKVATVKLGLMNDRLAEVKSGLKEGEQVIVGSSADLLPSQSIKSQDSLLPSTDDDDNQNGSEEVNQ